MNRGIVIFLGIFVTIVMLLICFLIFYAFRYLFLSMFNRIKSKRMIELNAIRQTSATFAQGLPLPAGVPCSIYLCEDKIVIEGNSVTFNLLNNKIYDISLNADADVQTFYASDAGSAVHGAMHHGKYGGLWGGRIRKIQDVSYTTYIIITYDNDGYVDYLIFGDLDYFKTKKLIKEFNKKYTNRPKAEIQL